MHPNIQKVVEDLTTKLTTGFSYGTAWLLMQITDLQIVYHLSRMTISRSPESKFPENVLLTPTRVHILADLLSMRHIRNCISLRGIVSALSLLHLQSAVSGVSGRPLLQAESERQLRENIINLSADIENSQGTEIEKGDCEFLVRYALNLLAEMPSDQPIALAVGSRAINAIFAAGTAYQFHGAESLRYVIIFVRKTRW
jgi:hypothetical protein